MCHTSTKASDNLLTPPIFFLTLCLPLLDPLLQKSSSSCTCLARIKSQVSSEDGVVQALNSALEDILVLGLSQNDYGPLASSNQRMKRIKSIHHSLGKHLLTAYSVPVLTLSVAA